MEELSKSGRATCKKCGLIGPVEAFRTPHKKGKDGILYYDYCKGCHGEDARASRYRRLYNITPEEYEKILKFQNGKCAICKRPRNSKQNRLAVDHCHRSGLIRGLLCWRCNKALGAFKDDQFLMWQALFYLFAPTATAVLGEERYGMLGRIKKKASKRVFGSAELENSIYRVRCSPEMLLEQLQLKALEIANAKAKRKESTKDNSVLPK